MTPIFVLLAAAVASAGGTAKDVEISERVAVHWRVLEVLTQVPPKASALGADASVACMADVHVSSDGSVTRVDVSECDLTYRDDIETALNQWQFSPHVSGEIAVPVSTTVPIRLEKGTYQPLHSQPAAVEPPDPESRTLSVDGAVTPIEGVAEGEAEPEALATITGQSTRPEPTRSTADHQVGYKSHVVFGGGVSVTTGGAQYTAAAHAVVFRDPLYKVMVGFRYQDGDAMYFTRHSTDEQRIFEGYSKKSTTDMTFDRSGMLDMEVQSNGVLAGVMGAGAGLAFHDQLRTTTTRDTDTKVDWYYIFPSVSSSTSVSVQEQHTSGPAPVAHLRMGLALNVGQVSVKPTVGYTVCEQVGFLDGSLSAALGF